MGPSVCVVSALAQAVVRSPTVLQVWKSFWTLLLTRKSFSTRLEDLVPRRTLCARTVVCAITVRDFASVSLDLPMMTAVVRTLLRCTNFTDVFFLCLVLCFVIKSQYTNK